MHPLQNKMKSDVPIRKKYFLIRLQFRIDNEKENSAKIIS